MSMVSSSEPNILGCNEASRAALEVRNVKQRRLKEVGEELLETKNNSSSATRRLVHRPQGRVTVS
jgi:hypothetical protein